MFNFATQPQSITRIYSDSVRLYKTTFLKVWPWQLLWQLPFFAYVLIDEDSPLAHKLSSLDGIFFNVTGIAILLVVVLLTVYGYLFNFHRIYNLVSPPYLKTRYSLTTVFKKILPVTGATLLVALLPLAIWTLTIAMSTPLKSISLSLAIITAIFVAIPLPFATLFYLFLVGYYLQLILLDNCSVLKSIKASCKLVWGNWWRNITVLISFSIIQSLITFLALILTSLIFSSLPTLGMVIDLIIISAISLFSFSILLVQFNDLKMRQCA